MEFRSDHPSIVHPQSPIVGFAAAAAAAGRTVNMVLSTLGLTKNNQTVYTDRAVTPEGVATLGVTPNSGVVGYPRAIESSLGTLSTSTSSMPNNYDRGVDMAAASLSNTGNQMTITLTLRRIVDMTLATLSTAVNKMGTMYDLGERRVRKTLSITAKLLRLLARNLTNGT
jgi:hypothetical protein